MAIQNTHSVEPAYMNSLNHANKQIAADLLRSCSLNELYQALTNQAALKAPHQEIELEQREVILKHTILTKLTYFTIHPQLTKNQLKELINIASRALDMPGESASLLIKQERLDAPIFAEWLEKVQLCLRKATA